MYLATAREMERLDELAVSSGLEIRQMMELAGFHMIEVLRFLGVSRTRRIVVVCGRGNKGGDGLSAARHLVNHGYEVSVVLESEPRKPDPVHQLALLRRMGIPIVTYKNELERAASCIREASVLIDALIGYHLDGAPRGSFAELIALMNASPAFTVAYDLPSGVNPDMGESEGQSIEADATLTLALPKRLFGSRGRRARSGRVFIADIGIPTFLYDAIAPGSRPPFEANGLTEWK